MSNRFIVWIKAKVLRRGVRRMKRLREFIYLDEVSVTSLLASILGAIPSEITEKLTNSTRSERSIGVSMGAREATFKPNAGVKRETTRTNDYQVLRKASIQATFRDLYSNVESSLTLRADPLPENISKLKRKIRTAQTGSLAVPPWIVPSADLRRGRLLELEVELRADALFRTSTIIASMTSIIGQSAALAAEVDTRQLQMASEINGFIRELMSGLIPIKCRALDYDVTTVAGKDLLVRKDLFPHMPEVYGRERKPLYVVGVLEEALFWKDIRRVLFSSSPVRVLCRVGRHHVQDSWSPVKLYDVLREVMPDMESVMGALGPSALRAMTGGVDSTHDPAQLRRRALIQYGMLIAESQGLTLPDECRVQIESIASSRASEMGSIEGNRAVFGEVASQVSSALACQISRDDQARMRSEALIQSGLMLDGSLSIRPESRDGRLEEPQNEKFLDVEIVAIYW
ncbi:DUF6414 family protein [Streptomyces sp. NBC_00354]|uniref:DUF6414 family protein n=1 Tax=Streptomyces sp. NBC_00354 TaxID=2975723 RepID=UPI002E25FFB3